MNGDIKKLWVASLRDGSFRKGKYQLRNLDDGFDVTGVLCELAVLNNIIPAPKKHNDEDGLFFGYTYNKLATGIPKEVEYWSGLSYRLGFSIALKGDEGMKFDELADWIQENL